MVRERTSYDLYSKEEPVAVVPLTSQVPARTHKSSVGSSVDSAGYKSSSDTLLGGLCSPLLFVVQMSSIFCVKSTYVFTYRRTVRALIIKAIVQCRSC